MISNTYIYDITFLVLFSLFVIIFLYIRRKNLKREGVMYLYRTQVGIKFINYFGKKYKKSLTVFSFLSIISGYVLMIIMVYLFGQLIFIYLFNPAVVQAVKIPPVMPLFPYVSEIFKISFLPPFYFTYWIIAIAVIAIFHEFSHGIVARRYGVKVKTTGFGFLGPFLAAFVEPDEKQMNRKSKFQQLAILSSGTFTNLILSILFFLLLSLFFVSAYVPAGAIFNSYTPEIVDIKNIVKIGDFSINNLNNAELQNIINENNIKDSFALGSDDSFMNYTRILAGNKTYFIDMNTLKEQLKTNSSFVILYNDLPAIEAGLKGAIIEINGNKIKDYNNLGEVMKNYKPRDKINIKTKLGDKTYEYEITLSEDSRQEGKGIIGIVNIETKPSGRFIARIVGFFDFFKKSGTFYEPRLDANLTLFIYNLIWWLALINFSVALMNMLPFLIFDGGKFFLLTIWAITGSEKIAQKAFKFVSYVILAALIVIMFGWAKAVF